MNNIWPNRALLMHSKLSQIIIHATNQNELLDQACKLAVEIGGYCSAWAGNARPDTEKTIEPTEVYGSAIEFINHITVTWSENKAPGRGPAGQTFRSGIPVICTDFTKDDSFKPWLINAQQYRLKGCVSLPLIDKELTFGLLYFF